MEKASIKLGSHRSDVFHRPTSSPIKNLVGTTKGSLSNLHRRRWVGWWKSKSFDNYHFSSSPNPISFIACVKSDRIRSYSGPYFLAFGLNMEKYSVSFRIQSECGKIQTRITPNTDTFHAVDGKPNEFPTLINHQKNLIKAVASENREFRTTVCLKIHERCNKDIKINIICFF